MHYLLYWYYSGTYTTHIAHSVSVVDLGEGPCPPRTSKCGVIIISPYIHEWLHSVCSTSPLFGLHSFKILDPPLCIIQNNSDGLSPDEEAIVWWVVAFTCIHQTLHSLSSRAISWLIAFLGALLLFLGRYSDSIYRIAAAFPSTLYKRNQYLTNKLLIPSVCNYVVCSTCLHLYQYQHCFEKVGTRTQIRSCDQCPRKTMPLLREIVTSSKNTKYYPFKVFPSVCLISSLQSLFSIPDFYNQCEQWRFSF